MPGIFSFWGVGFFTLWYNGLMMDRERSWAGWLPHMVGRAWLDGEITTEDLHEHCTDSEYLRAQRDRYTELLVVRYDPLLRPGGV